MLQVSKHSEYSPYPSLPSLSQHQQNHKRVSVYFTFFWLLLKYGEKTIQQIISPERKKKKRVEGVKKAHFRTRSVRDILSLLRIYCFWMQQNSLSLNTSLHRLVLTTLFLLPFKSHCKCTFSFCTRLHAMHECKIGAGKESLKPGLDCSTCQGEAIEASLVYNAWMQAVHAANQGKGGTAHKYWKAQHPPTSCRP